MTEDELKLQHELTEIRRSAGARYPGYSDIHLAQADATTIIHAPFEVLDVLTTAARIEPECGLVAVLVLGRLVGDVFSECQLQAKALTRQVNDYKANEELLTKEIDSLRGQIELMRSSIKKAKQEALEARQETETHVRERSEANRQRTLTEARLFCLENALGKKQVEELLKGEGGDK